MATMKQCSSPRNTEEHSDSAYVPRMGGDSMVGYYLAGLAVGIVVVVAFECIM